MTMLACAALAWSLASPAAAQVGESTGTALSPPAAPAAEQAPAGSFTAPTATGPVVVSTGPAVPPEAAAPQPPPSAAGAFGVPLRPDRGPWVLGEVRFRGSETVSEYALQSKVRARRGSLYMPEDVNGDVAALMQTGSFASVESSVYGIPDQHVPEGYASISVSTMMARLVFTLTDKGAPGTSPSPLPRKPQTAPRPEDKIPPSPISGVVMTPTAYRGFGRHNEPGLGLDINAVYYIGRLYGKNSLDYTTQKTNFIDRVGIWMISADGKLQLQSEGDWRPAAAVGAQGVFTFRDAPQPNIATPNVTVQVSAKTTKGLGDAYFVLSKKVWKVRNSVGYMFGNFGDSIGGLTEFLSDQALLFNGHPNQTAQSKSIFFASLMLHPKPQYPLAVEFLKPNGMALQPYLINFKLGYFLHLNFDIAYLKFAGGWDLLGMFQFRTNYFPRK